MIIMKVGIYHGGYGFITHDSYRIQKRSSRSGSNMRVDNHDVFISLNNKSIAHRVNVTRPSGEIYAVRYLFETVILVLMTLVQSKPLYAPTYRLTTKAGFEYSLLKKVHCPLLASLLSIMARAKMIVLY